MATFEQIIDEHLHRIPDDQIENVFLLVNRAIRLISKRLYLHKSDLIRGDADLNLYASVSYTADTIAFVSGATSTITDSADQFVAEGFQSGMYIETDHATNTGPYLIDSVAVGTLTLDSGDSVTSESAGTDYTITSLANYCDLPSDFWGLITNPRIPASRRKLVPLPGVETRLRYEGISGTPLYFSISGKHLRVYPETGGDIVISVEYYKKPTSITALTDTMPWYELFDDAIGEYIVALIHTGASFDATTAGEIQKLLFDAVDLVVSSRSMPAAKGMPGGINYDDYY